jgi:Ca2+-binding EF-hand superfamily protein
LNEHGIFVTNQDLVALISRYDKNQDGKVSYGEFLSELTPKSP